MYYLDEENVQEYDQIRKYLGKQLRYKKIRLNLVAVKFNQFRSILIDKIQENQLRDNFHLRNYDL